MLLLCKPYSIAGSLHIKPTILASTNPAGRGAAAPMRRRTALETRISLVLALASQASSLSQRVLGDLATETAKYVFPQGRMFEARNLEEALMSVPDLETMRFKVLRRMEQYEIREVEGYFIAETTMPGNSGFDLNGSSQGFNVLAAYLFDLNGSSQGFNVLAAYLFGKNTATEQMEMTTPVFTRKVKATGEKMDMTTPVITTKSGDQDSWQMSFIMPAKYGANLPVPVDPTVRIREVPRRIMAVAAFSGFVTDEDIKRRESNLRNALKRDTQFQVKEGASVEVAQFNPPFTLPFSRRNEIALEVERKTQ